RAISNRHGHGLANIRGVTAGDAREPNGENAGSNPARAPRCRADSKSCFNATIHRERRDVADPWVDAALSQVGCQTIGGPSFNAKSTGTSSVAIAPLVDDLTSPRPSTTPALTGVAGRVISNLTVFPSGVRW